MLKRINISGYKSLKNVEVELQSLSVLFGPNGAGKSNFLDALQLLSKIATSRTLKDAFEPPYRGKPLESFTFGPKGIKGLLESRGQSFSIEVDVELSPTVVESVNRQVRDMKRTFPEEESAEALAKLSAKVATVRERNLRYRIEVEILPKHGILRVTDEYMAALTSKGEPTGKRKPFLERVGNKLHLRMEGQAHPTYYERHLDHSILSLPNYPPHYPHLVAMRKELESWRFFYFEPRERMRAANPVKELKQYLRDLYQQPGELPDLVLVATDANCMGLAERTKMIGAVTEKVGVRIVCAIPDPHIERWLLVASAAFKTVFGRGCNAPDQKCGRARYKMMLIGAIRESRITPSLGGIEYAEDIVNEMDLDRVARNDDSLGRLPGDLDAVFREWTQ